MQLLTNADIVEQARLFFQGTATREKLASWARNIIDQSENGSLTVDEDAWELLTYLVLIDEMVPPNRYLYTEEEIGAELKNLGC